MNYKHECLILNLVLLLLKSKDYGHYNDKKALITERNIFCVDTWMWSDEHLGQKFREIEKNFLYNINEYKNIYQIKSSSNLFFLNNKKLYDCIYIDGDHTRKGLLADINAWWDKVNHQTGIICGDDFSWPEVKKACDVFFQQKGLKYSLLAKPNRADFPIWYFDFSQPMSA